MAWKRLSQHTGNTAETPLAIMAHVRSMYACALSDRGLPGLAADQRQHVAPLLSSALMADMTALDLLSLMRTAATQQALAADDSWRRVVDAYCADDGAAGTYDDFYNFALKAQQRHEQLDGDMTGGTRAAAFGAFRTKDKVNVGALLREKTRIEMELSKLRDLPCPRLARDGKCEQVPLLAVRHAQEGERALRGRRHARREHRRRRQQQRRVGVARTRSAVGMVRTQRAIGQRRPFRAGAKCTRYTRTDFRYP